MDPNRVDRPPRLQLDLPVSTSSFKRTFEELGFELENDGNDDNDNEETPHDVLAGSSSDEGSPSSSRNKRARSELSDFGSASGSGSAGASTHNTTPSLNLSPIEGVSPISNSFSSRWPHADDDNDSMDVEDETSSGIVSNADTATPALPFYEPASPPLDRTLPDLPSSPSAHTLGLPEQDYFPHSSGSSSNATPPWLRPTPPTLTIPTINTAFDSTDTLVNLTNGDTDHESQDRPYLPRTYSLDSPSHPSLPPIQTTLHPRRNLLNLLDSYNHRTNPLFAANANDASSPVAGPSTGLRLDSPLLPYPPAPRAGVSYQYDDQREEWVSQAPNAPSPSPLVPRSASAPRRRHLGEFLELAPSPSPTTQLGWRFGSGSSTVGSPDVDERLEHDITPAESPTRQRPTLFPRTQHSPLRLRDNDPSPLSLVLPPLESERARPFNRSHLLETLDRSRSRRSSNESRNLPVIELNEQGPSNRTSAYLTPWGENILRALSSSTSNSSLSVAASSADEQQVEQQVEQPGQPVDVPEDVAPDPPPTDPYSDRMLRLAVERSASSTSTPPVAFHNRMPRPSSRNSATSDSRQEHAPARPFPLRAGSSGSQFNGLRLPMPPEPIRWLGDVRSHSHGQYQSQAFTNATAAGARSYRSLMQRPSTAGSQTARERPNDTSSARPSASNSARRSLHLDLTGFNASFEQDGDLEPYLRGGEQDLHGIDVEGDGDAEEEDAEASDDDVSVSSIRATTSITRGARVDDMIEDEPAPSLDWPPILPLDSPQPVPRAPSFHRWLNESPSAADPPPEILFDTWAESTSELTGQPQEQSTSDFSSEEPRLTLPSFPSLLDLSTPAEIPDNTPAVASAPHSDQGRPTPHIGNLNRLGLDTNTEAREERLAHFLNGITGESWYSTRPTGSRPFSRGVRMRNDSSHGPSSAGIRSRSERSERSERVPMDLLLPPLALGDRDLSRGILHERQTHNEDSVPLILSIHEGQQAESTNERLPSLDSSISSASGMQSDHDRGDRVRMHDLLLRSGRRASDEMHSETEAPPPRASRWGELQDASHNTSRTRSAWREMPSDLSETRPPLTARGLALFNRNNDRPSTSGSSTDRRDHHQLQHGHLPRHHRRMNGRPSSSDEMARSFSSMEEFLEDFDRRNPVAPSSTGPAARSPHPRPWRNGLGDFMSDTEWDGSYDNLLRLGAILGEVKVPGTAPEIIAGLPTSTYQDWTARDKDAEIRCPICLDDYELTDRLQRLQDCQHWFHRDCLGQWLKSAQSCPVCRKQIKQPGASSGSSRFQTSEGLLASRRRAFNWTFGPAPSS